MTVWEDADVSRNRVRPSLLRFHSMTFAHLWSSRQLFPSDEEPTPMKSIRFAALLFAVGLMSCMAFRAAAASKRPPRCRGRIPNDFSGGPTHRFGMFIHWGPVALKETEISWSRANSNRNAPIRERFPVEVYDNLYKKFNPTDFNAKEWVAIAKAAGMKYMVLTVKHCDGFLLWDSKVSRLQHHAHPLQTRR